MDKRMGGIWATTPVSVVPDIVLRQWTVVQLSDGDRHFIGYNATEGEGRVSSKIVAWDKKTRIGTTNSGRKYHLAGGSGINMDAGYVWGRWMTLNSIDPSSTKDVSSEYEHEEKPKKIRKSIKAIRRKAGQKPRK